MPVKTLRLLLIVLLALTEPLRAWGVETMAAGAMFGAPRAAAMSASAMPSMPAMAGMQQDCSPSMRMSGAGQATPAHAGATHHDLHCPLCGDVPATPPAAIALRQPALREPFLGHGVMPFSSAIPDALDPPPRRST